MKQQPRERDNLSRRVEFAQLTLKVASQSLHGDQRHKLLFRPICYTKIHKMTVHTEFMRRCFQLARKGEGVTHPNPMVGAVVVHAGKIIGEGYHRRYGEAHAEGERHHRRQGYVTAAPIPPCTCRLEPCSAPGQDAAHARN